MLPPNLVTLNVVGCPSNALPCFAEMFLALAASMQIGLFRALKHITCSARSVFMQERNDTFDTLAVAVKLVYERPLLDSQTFDDAEWRMPGAVLDADDERRFTYLWEDEEEDPVVEENGELNDEQAGEQNDQQNDQ